MNVPRMLACALCALSIPACGYHLGGMKNASVKDMNTCCVHMFSNQSLYPLAAVQMTSALAEALQCDGTFRLAAPGEADMAIDGLVSSVKLSSVRTNLQDTYVSDEVRLTVKVDYRITRAKDGKVLQRGSASESVTCFLELGNTVSAKEDAVSYAVRKAADRVVEKLTTP